MTSVSNCFTATILLHSPDMYGHSITDLNLRNVPLMSGQKISPFTVQKLLEKYGYDRLDISYTFYLQGYIESPQNCETTLTAGLTYEKSGYLSQNDMVIFQFHSFVQGLSIVNSTKKLGPIPADDLLKEVALFETYRNGECKYMTWHHCNIFLTIDITLKNDLIQKYTPLQNNTPPYSRTIFY
jgi:hypothetical protein